MIRTFTLILIICSLSAAVCGQEEDTVYVEPPLDTLRQPSDTSDTLLLPDTLSGAQKAASRFEERFKEYQEEKVERKPNLSFFDSLKTYFASERLNQRISIEQSYLRDAGDYFHFDPSYFVTDYIRTPMRKTVQPFGLSGDRLNVIADGLPIRPFEHWIEPDGLTDINDIPTAGDYDRYIIPGPAGLIFGGDRAVASLITSPKRPKSNSAESAILVDQGGFEYNYVRGKYSKLFANGREIDMSIGYRNADGDAGYRDDDVYHYTGRISQPLGLNYVFNAQGQLYDRNGHFFAQRSVAGNLYLQAFERARVDRSAELSIEKYNADHDAVSRLGYRYLRQGSYIDGTYHGRFDKNGWGAFVNREWVSGTSAMKIEASGSHERYHDGRDDFPRDKGEILASLAKLAQGTRYALTAGGSYIDGFNFLPLVAAMVSVDRPGLFALFSAGYAERAPSLYELHLRFRRATLFSTDTKDYADQGNGDLKKEKQLVGSGLIELGSTGTNIRLSVTGGRIYDGIDWRHSEITDAGGNYQLFEPANGNVDFADISLQQKLALNNSLNLRSGGAYHFVEYDYTSNREYLPDYQLFSGLELHIYWPQKLMNLFAYGEIVYVSEYDGYDIRGLGKEIVANAKLSFRIKDFRFHWVMQNVLSNLYYQRESILHSGRYVHLGLVWNFLD